MVQRFQAGDDAAFDELYGRYRRRLERFCLKRVGDHHSAEEVAQEAFTRALAALPTFGGERRFYPWVSVIASRLCVDHHRNQARSELTPDVHCPPVLGGQDDIVDAVDAELVTSAMARLGPRHQDVLRLREVESWSYRRIADHYEVPISTIETLLFRARRALRREFDIIDGAGLAAVPFLGWILHGVGRVKDRLAPLVSKNPAQSGLAAAATATVAAVAIAIVPAAQTSTPPVTRSHVAGAPAPSRPRQLRLVHSTVAPSASSTAPKPAAVIPAVQTPTPVLGAVGQLPPAAGPAVVTVAGSVATTSPPSPTPISVSPTTSPPITVPPVSSATLAPPVPLPPAVPLPPVALPVAGSSRLPLDGPASGVAPALRPNGIVSTLPDGVGTLAGNLKL